MQLSVGFVRAHVDGHQLTKTDHERRARFQRTKQRRPLQTIGHAQMTVLFVDVANHSLFLLLLLPRVIIVVIVGHHLLSFSLVVVVVVVAINRRRHPTIPARLLFEYSQPRISFSRAASTQFECDILVVIVVKSEHKHTLVLVGRRHTRVLVHRILAQRSLVRSRSLALVLANLALSVIPDKMSLSPTKCGPFLQGTTFRDSFNASIVAAKPVQ
mmetsp:Transcript_1964/g.3820  ORF Transcript_1964/g.3820 Transcript_1964/m.3820 type:complete len:214 (-) Transcript_1964:107-748(-)